MRLRLLSAGVAACGLLLAVPVSAQGVKIGILNDQSGVYADYGGKWSFEAAKMAVEDFGGSVLGHRIEIVSADHQNKPGYKIDVVSADHQNKADVGANKAREWFDTQNVDMITELTTSSVALAVHDLSKQTKKIDIVVGAATSRLRRCLPALRLSLGLRHPRVGLRHRRLAGGCRRRHLVLHDRRLRLRLRAGKGHRRLRQDQRRQGPGTGSHPAQLLGFLVLPAAGAS